MADAGPGEARQADLDSGAGTDLVEISGLAVPASGGAIVVGGFVETINVLGVGGGVASGVADLGNPVKIGGRAQATAPTAVTAGQRANAWLGLNGQLVAALADISGNLVTVTSNRLIVDASGVAVPITDNGGSLTVDAPVGTPVFVRLSDGAAALIGQKAMAASLPVVIASDQSAVAVTVSSAAVAGTTAHDAPGAAVNPVAAGGYANAAAPADVSADVDVVRAWHLRNGAQATVITAAGALIGGAAATGLFADIRGIGGAAPSATVPLPTRLTDGAAFYAKTGQTLATAAFAQLSDQTTAVAVIAATAALKTDLSSVAGTATVTAGVAGVQSIGGPTVVDLAVAANPVTIGGRASQATPGAMSADGDVVNGWFDRSGRQIVAPKSGTGSNTSVAGSASSVTVLAANTARLGATVYNESTAILYLLVGSTAASATNYTVQMFPQAYYEAPFGFTGQLTGIWASATGNARITEVTS